MLLTELLYQRVKELGAQGTVALKPGYVAIASRASSLRALLVAALFPDPKDTRQLSDVGASRPAEGGPTRVGVGLIGKDGQPYRLLRELGGARQLHRFDPALKKFSSITQDDLEIASFLRGETELSEPEAYGKFFVLGQSELPSLAALPAQPSANLAQADLVKAQQLKKELEQTRAFEAAQDQLFKVQQRLQELGEQGSRLESAEKDLAELEAQLSRSLFSPAQIRELTSRAQRFAAEQKKHADQVGELGVQLRALEGEMPPEPEPLFRDPLFLGGIAGGLALDAVAFAVAHPGLAVVGLIPFGAALVAALRWIDAGEQRVVRAAQVKRGGDRLEAIKKAFTEEHAPLRAAFKAAAVGGPEELLELFKHRDEVARARDDAKVWLEKLRAQPGLAEIAKERPMLLEEKVSLEMTVAAQGFARPLSEIERDLRHAMGIMSDPNLGKVKPASGVEPAQAPKALVEVAAQIAALPPGELWLSLSGRLAAYLGALTDKKVVAARMDAGGALSAFAPDGRGGPYTSLPQPLRDLVFSALRLALLERVAKVKRLPVFVDDAFAPLEPQKRALVHKMLKGIGQETQVLHRAPEPPPPGLADHVVQLP